MRKPATIFAVTALLAGCGVGGWYLNDLLDPDSKPLPSAWVCPGPQGQTENFTVITDPTLKARGTAWQALRAGGCRPGVSADRSQRVLTISDHA